MTGGFELKRIGAEEIFELFNTNANQIAVECGLKRQSVYEWFKKGKIPDKRVEQLSEKFGVPTVYFNKELTQAERMEIQIIKLRQDDVAHEIPQLDDEGNEVGTTTWYENEGVIQQFNIIKEDFQKIDNIKKNINELLSNKVVYEQGGNSDSNIDLLSNVIGAIKSNDDNQKLLLRLISEFINLDAHKKNNDELEIALGFYDPKRFLRFIPTEKEKFAKELLELLFEHDIVSSPFLKKYLGKDK
jgi:ribosomal protein S16